MLQVKEKSDGRLAESAFMELAQLALKAGNSLRFRSTGQSMHPFIKDGDVITVAPLPSRAPGLGDVVLFKNERARRLFVHRITKRDGGLYVTRGDNAYLDDDTVATTNLLGYVTRVERNGKTVRLGLGPERSMLAMLARCGLLSPIVFRLWCYMRPFLT
jgi:signal peptidase I